MTGYLRFSPLRVRLDALRSNLFRLYHSFCSNFQCGYFYLFERINRIYHCVEPLIYFLVDMFTHFYILYFSFLPNAEIIPRTYLRHYLFLRSHSLFISHFLLQQSFKGTFENTSSTSRASSARISLWDEESRNSPWKSLAMSQLFPWSAISHEQTHHEQQQQPAHHIMLRSANHFKNCYFSPIQCVLVEDQ